MSLCLTTYAPAWTPDTEGRISPLFTLDPADPAPFLGARILICRYGFSNLLAQVFTPSHTFAAHAAWGQNAHLNETYRCLELYLGHLEMATAPLCPGPLSLVFPDN